MRELTKSMISYSLATTILGLQQMGQMLTSGGDMSETTAVINDVTARMVGHMSDPARSTFQGADRLQRTAVDILLGGWIPSADDIRKAICAVPGSKKAGGTGMMSSAPQEAVGPMGAWDWEDAQVPDSTGAERPAYANAAV